MKRKTKKPVRSRKRSTTKKSPLKPLLIGGAVIGAAYLGYQYILKPYLDKQAEEDTTGADAAAAAAAGAAGMLPPPEQKKVDNTINQIVDIANSIPAGTVKLDPNKTIKPGDPASQELKQAKIGFNDVMILADRIRNSWTPNVSETIYKLPLSRYNAIADLRKDLKATNGVLDASTGYGEYSQKVAKTILGKTSFTLNDARKQREQFYYAMGKQL